MLALFAYFQVWEHFSPSLGTFLSQFGDLIFLVWERLKPIPEAGGRLGVGCVGGRSPPTWVPSDCTVLVTVSKEVPLFSSGQYLAAVILSAASGSK